jgi:hypothetical protein
MQHALPKTQLLQALRSQFGFDSFRPFQEVSKHCLNLAANCKVACRCSILCQLEL